MSLISSWDYVDPSLTRTFLQLTKIIDSINSEITQINSSGLLSSQLKHKLLEKKLKLLQTSKSNLAQHKLLMIDYYDKQSNILSKQTNIIKDKSILDESTIQISKLTNNFAEITFENAIDFKKKPFVQKRKNKNLLKIIKYQRSLIKRIKCSRLKQQPQLYQHQTSRTDVDYKSKYEQNQQYLNLLKTKMNLMEQYYQSRQSNIINQFQKRIDKLVENNLQNKQNNRFNK